MKGKHQLSENRQWGFRIFQTGMNAKSVGVVSGERMGKRAHV